MPNEIATDVLWACAAINAVLLTLALGKAVADYLRGKTFTGQTKTVLTTVMGGGGAAWEPSPAWTATTGSMPTLARPAAPLSASPPEVAEIKAAPKEGEGIFPPLTNGPTKPPDDFVLDCGSCHKQIKSPPTSVKNVGGKTEMRYQCEHCKAVVAVKL